MDLYGDNVEFDIDPNKLDAGHDEKSSVAQLKYQLSVGNYMIVKISGKCIIVVFVVHFKEMKINDYYLFFKVKQIFFLIL